MATPKAPVRLMPDILFVTALGENSVSFSRSAVFTEKDTKVVDTGNIVNQTDSSLKTGDKIIAETRFNDENPSIVVKKIIARQQPVADSDKEYLKLLRIYVDDKDQSLDFLELNNILRDIMGMTVDRFEATTHDYDLVIDLCDEDPGTKRCPWFLAMLSTSYPLKVSFPTASAESKEYLKLVYPEGKVTDTRIFAFRLIHFLLHRLGHLDHLDAQFIEKDKALSKAVREGDPSQIPPLDTTNACLCDWELIHLACVQASLVSRSFEKMVCDRCEKKKQIPVGVGFTDFEMLVSTILKDPKKHSPYLRTTKDIFYVIEKKSDGLVLNLAPYKSETTVDITGKDWNKTILDVSENLHNFLVPYRLLGGISGVGEGDKILLHIDTAARIEENGFGVLTQAQAFKIDRTIKKRVKVILPHSLSSRIRPFRLCVRLKIGPETDLSVVRNVARIVSRVTGWRVEIDKTSYERLGNSFEALTKVYEEWKQAEPSARSGLIAKVKESLDGLAPRIDEVEDNFKVIVYIFPDRFTFLDDVLGNISFGMALNRIFAVVSIYPSTPHWYETQEPCKDCQNKPSYPWREQMTALFIIHEVLHIASGLDDHRNCPSCSYRRNEMRSLRRYRCEECLKKGNNQTQSNCLMSYECVLCISTRLSQNVLRQLLCEKCEKKLLPTDQFAAKQASRMNWLIYQRSLGD